MCLRFLKSNVLSHFIFTKVWRFLFNKRKPSWWGNLSHSCSALKKHSLSYLHSLCMSDLEKLTVPRLSDVSDVKRKVPFDKLLTWGRKINFHRKKTTGFSSFGFSFKLCFKFLVTDIASGYNLWGLYHAIATEVTCFHPCKKISPRGLDNNLLFICS